MTGLRKAFWMLALGGVLLWSGGAPAQAPTPPAPVQQTTLPAPIGGVATVQGGASVTRGAQTNPLKVKDAIFKGDVLQTAANGTLGITFDDATTFSLQPNSRLAVDEFVYQEHGAHNAGAFNVMRGTAAFVAAAVAKTGDMKIDTPTATIGIRGTTGVIDVLTGTAGTVTESNIKLYADADGRVGRIEIFGRDGTPLGVLNRAVTGFAVNPGPAGRSIAVPLRISAQEADRDFGFLRRTFTSQRLGRQLNLQRQNLLRRNQPRPALAPPAGQPRQRLNLLPPAPPNPAIGPTLLQPQPGGPSPNTLPSTVPGVPSSPDALPPVTPPSLPPVQPTLPTPSTPSLPRLPLPR
jgi:FecR protein